MGGVVGELDTGGRESFPLVPEVGVVRRDGSRGARPRIPRQSVRGCCSGFGPVADEAVVVGFFQPLVDDGARPGVCHFGAEDGGLVVEEAWWGGVAAGFGEEDGDVVVAGVSLQVDIAGDGVGGDGTAPLVGVQGEEVEVFGRVAPTC